MPEDKVGRITHYDVELGRGTIALDDGGEVTFDDEACGARERGGCVAALGARARVVRWIQDANGMRATQINGVGVTSYSAFVPSLTGRPSRRMEYLPVRASIESFSVLGKQAAGLAGGWAFARRACLGFEPEPGMEVWLCEITSKGSEIQAMYAVDNAPSWIEEAARHARAREAEEAAVAAEAAKAKERQEHARSDAEFDERKARIQRFYLLVEARDAGTETTPLPAVENPLLDAVLRAPDDDAPRLALAQSLEGSKLAELIKLQIAGIATEEDDRHARALAAKLEKPWRPPKGVFTAIEYRRGFIAEARIKSDPLHALEARGAWQLGTIEAIHAEGPIARDVYRWSTYRELVTSPRATALKRLDWRSGVAPEACPAFALGRLNGLAHVTLGELKERNAFTYARFDPIEHLHVDAQDPQWTKLLELLTESPPEVFARRPLSLHVHNRGCGRIDRRKELIAAWSKWPARSAAVWDIELERTAGGTIARFAGWSPDVTSAGLSYAGFFELAALREHVDDLIAIEAHGSAPPDERHIAAASNAFPGVDVRFVFCPWRAQRDGVCDF